MKCDRHRIAAPEVDDVAVFEESFVDLLVVDVRSVRRITVDEEHFSIDRNDFRVKTRHLRIFQYDLTNHRFASDPNAGAAEAEALTGARSVEDRELAEDARRQSAERPILRIAAARRDD